MNNNFTENGVFCHNSRLTCFPPLPVTLPDSGYQQLKESVIICETMFFAKSNEKLA